MVTPFEELDGIYGIVSGYTGGHVEHPTYEQVKTGTTGHYEAVQITFDPDVFPYENCWSYIGVKLIQRMTVDNFMTVVHNIEQQFYHNERQKH